MILESTWASDAPNRSTSARNKLGIKKSSFSNIVKSIGFHSYKTKLRPALKDAHKQFGEWMTPLSDSYLKHSVFSDESHFSLTGKFQLISQFDHGHSPYLQ